MISQNHHDFSQPLQRRGVRVHCMLSGADNNGRALIMDMKPASERLEVPLRGI